MKRQFLPIDALSAWTKLNGVSFEGVEVRRLHTEDGIGKGSAVFATRSRVAKDFVPGQNQGAAEPEILMSIPADLVLSLNLVDTYAKSDMDLREVLDAMGEFGRSARGAILIYLLLALTHLSHDSSNESKGQVGLCNPWTGYVQFLPESYTLPTFYTDGEFEILQGTSLKPALEAKLDSLEREFEQLRESTKDIAWCKTNWWHGETGKLTFYDWKIVDSMYRSRALEVPGIGHAMVPCVDMANHASGEDTNAMYDVDGNGNVVLQLHYGQRLEEGDEVTITYGDEKGAAEMIFSYGFLEDTVSDARQLFLDLQIPDDDPLKPAKLMVCDDPPGVRLFLASSPGMVTKINWESPFVWWACVNEEDGLGFEVVQANSGEREIRAAWKGEEIESSEKLRDLLQREPLWDIYQLRATVIVQDRVATQLELLQESGEYVQEWREKVDGATIRPLVWDTVMKLREIEMDFLAKANDQLEDRKLELANTPVVQQYLRQYSPGADIAEDFS
ncbi:hypothetical protein D8B26_002704 [Coccidioides posadasii str. Silveira]|uniref:Uncharacterized protein n=2 Tax=Coccidioides posadasii TaxID=199306 RepID=E9CYK1_COCPS|nr:hypothetical protein CPSG_02871 [Coccidioides posadasii str. Silveira]KMM66758.1 hypothetical protein CPAG_03096 [Coccidioides posadasii RMSCC 3488]QVM08009.1 hypothetical protein D8B26_002704 [Coccidioides posadasii str. Silveira]